MGAVLATVVCTSPLTAQASAASLVSARQKVFGTEHVDPATGDLPRHKVLFSWLSNSTFAASIQGRVVYLDSYVTRLEVEPGRTPFVVQDLIDVRPEAILLGHGHSDHADNAAYIAAKTGAVIYATEETCVAMKGDFERMRADPVIQSNERTRFAPDARVRCVEVTTAGSAPGAEVQRLEVLEPRACVVAFRHLHSVAVPPDTSFPPTPVRIIVDPRDAELFPAGTPLTPGSVPLPGQMDIRTSGDPGGSESLFYGFALRGGSNFTFVWHNTAGALKEGKGRGWDGTPADGERVVALLESLPPTDVQLGTASTGNFANNGLRDLIMYQAALKPRIYIPNHLTTGSSTREASSMSIYAGYLDQLDLMGVSREAWPEIRWLIDPTDYLRPMSFDTDDPTWRDARKAAAMRRLCDGGAPDAGGTH